MWALPSVCSYNELRIPWRWCLDIIWARENSLWNLHHPRTLILNEEFQDRKASRKVKGLRSVGFSSRVLSLGFLSSIHFDNEKIGFPNCGQLKWAWYGLGITRKNDAKLSRNNSVQLVHSFSTSLLYDYTEIYLAEGTCFPSLCKDQHWGSVKVGLSFALFSLLSDFVLLRIAGNIKDLWAF